MEWLWSSQSQRLTSIILSTRRGKPCQSLASTARSHGSGSLPFPGLRMTRHSFSKGKISASKTFSVETSPNISRWSQSEIAFRGHKLCQCKERGSRLSMDQINPNKFRPGSWEVEIKLRFRSMKIFFPQTKEGYSRVSLALRAWRIPQFWTSLTTTTTCCSTQIMPWICQVKSCPQLWKDKRLLKILNQLWRAPLPWTHPQIKGGRSRLVWILRITSISLFQLWRVRLLTSKTLMV